MPLLSLRDVSLAFGGPKLLDGVSLALDRGERLGLLGRNGEGKSTLLKLLAGELPPDSGEVVRQQGLRVALLPQEVPEGRPGTVSDEIARGLDAPGHPGDTADHRVAAIASRVGLDPDAPFDALSSGMKRRALLARALVAEPDVLLLDEPTNHLDVPSIRWLEDFLLRQSAALVFVTHDRAFLERLATRIVELDRGRASDWACDYPTFLVRREQQLAAEERQAALFDKKLAQEETWIRKGIEARRTRNEGRVRALKAMREARRRRRDKQGTARLQLQESERSGALVTEAKGAAFAYGDRPILRGLDVQIMRGDKVGIVGPNGSGKTTLLRLILGELEPTEGSIRRGTKQEIAYFDQLRAVLDEDKTVQQNISETDFVPIDNRPRHVLGYLQDFLFTPERARGSVKVLSGGERSRLTLAKLFTKPSNLLVLDEPTNDLDLETLELLEGLLVEYQGTVLLVSHDRAFLNNVVGSTLAVAPDGTVKEFDGGWDDAMLRTPAGGADRPGATQATPGEPGASAPGGPQRIDARPRKLSYKERKELDELPARIDALESTLRDLHAKMADPDFYKQGREAIAATTAEVEEAEKALEAAFQRWDELESA